MDKDAQKTIKKILSGYKRKVANLKQQGVMKVTEGKAQITFDGYKTIAQKALSATVDFGLNTFAWVFLLISWNIMARCSTSSAIMIDHIEWENDSLLLHVPLHKGDQDGETSKLQRRRCAEYKEEHSLKTPGVMGRRDCIGCTFISSRSPL